MHACVVSGGWFHIYKKYDIEQFYNENAINKTESHQSYGRWTVLNVLLLQTNVLINGNLCNDIDWQQVNPSNSPDRKSIFIAFLWPQRWPFLEESTQTYSEANFFSVA